MARVVYTTREGEVTEEQPKLAEGSYVLALDGSATRSGVSIVGVDGKLGFTSAVVRGKENLIGYKIELKRYLKQLIEEYGIKYAGYEEPFIGYAGNVKELYAISTSLEELVLEWGLETKVVGVNNLKWKKGFLDSKVKGNSSVQKKQIRVRAIELEPGLEVLEKNKGDYDESDAYGLGWYIAKNVRENTIDNVKSGSKPRPFKYNIKILGGKVLGEEAVKGMRKKYEDGVIVEDISSKRSFDEQVYRLLQGKNGVLVLHFKSGKFGSKVLAEDAGEKAATNEYLTAVVTRKSRTKSK